MGKRKQVAPKHVDEAKRQQLQWNMADQGSSHSLSKTAHLDHTLQKEDVNQPGSSSLPPSHINNDNASSFQTPLHALCVDAFYQNLARCHTNLTMFNKDHAMIKGKYQSLCFGSFKVTLKPHLHMTTLPDQLPDFKECWLYLSSYKDPHMLYFEKEDNNENVVQKRKSKSRLSNFGVFWFASLNVPTEVISRLRPSKLFWIVCDYFDTQLKELKVTIYGSLNMVMQLSHPSESISVKSPQIAIQRLMEFYYDVPCVPHNKFRGRTENKADDFSHLYEQVMLIQRDKLCQDSSWEEEVSNIRHHCLKPLLRPYQKESIAWMLRQEKNILDCNSSAPRDMHPLYREVKLRDNTLLYYNRYGGSFIKYRPEANLPLPGGILADEMGLGKTVEILCCMLLNPRQNQEQPEPLPVLEDEDTDTYLNEDESSLTGSPNQKEAGTENSPQSNSLKDISDCSTHDSPLPANTDGLSENSNPKDVTGVSAPDASVSTAVGGSSENSSIKSMTGDNSSLSDQPSTDAKRVKKKRRSKGTVEYVLVSEDDHSIRKTVSQKQFFECNCGQLESEEETVRKGLHTVKCNICGMSQHAECMRYNLKDPFRGEYLCPHCHAVSSKVKSGATLIISPQSICHQWIDEINKHIKECSIKVFIYTGVSKLGYIQPQTLAQQDIVITTYDVLRKEVDYANLPHTNSETGRRFRHPKRFLATPSPMVAVEWWRICLDEAQMVECVTTKTAEMAMRLRAVNRWCVTGTPLMRSVEDIYGLLLFLGLDPFMVQQWFKSFIYEPYCYGIRAPMYHTLAQVFWRTAKKDVIDQIQLPAKTEETYWLTFSPVEEHFYRRQYEMYRRSSHAMRGKTRQWKHPNIKLHTLDRKSLNELLYPLFKLRQACCHPQIVRGAFLPLTKTMMSMEELLEHMTKKAKTECEEAHRQIVSSLNGLAGLAILKKRLLDAVDLYRDVLRSVEEQKDRFRTDELQQLHAMHNLAFVLEQKPEGVAPTLRDDSLGEQCEDLKNKYMAKALTKFTAANETLKQSKTAVEDIEFNMTVLNADDWWADVVEIFVQRGIGPELVDKVKDDLSRTSRVEGSIMNVLRSTDSLLFIVDSHLQHLKKARSSLTSNLDELSQNISPELVHDAAVCCMRPIDKILETCPFCRADKLFNEYESKLFMFVERGVTVTEDDSTMAYQVNTQRQGTRADSEVEKVLKSILTFYRLRFDTDEDIIKAANLQVKHFEALKKEFKRLRAVWLGHRERVSSTDELEMAIERLRFREAHEPQSTTKILNVIEVYEMRANELKFKSDEIVGRNELRRKQGQLIYLKNLAKQSQEGRDHNPDLCPICQQELGAEWSVMLCGHCFCLDCMRTLMDRNMVGFTQYHDQRLKCPMCRNTMSVREIAYVTTKKRDQVDVKGSHSTKIQAIVECLIKTRRADSTAKSLVFSTWVSVLDILGAALAENNIPYRCLHDAYTFQKNLSAFKEDQSIQVLLLPLHTGANGLNLVEANHILFVEPELNLEQEAQAISRICRIGQTRQTKIHRFLVRGTIEEKIHDMVKALRDSKSNRLDEQEACELTVGDITSLLEQPCPDEIDEDDPTVNGDINTISTMAQTAEENQPPSSRVEQGGSGDAPLPSTSSHAMTVNEETTSLSSSSLASQNALSSSSAGDEVVSNPSQIPEGISTDGAETSSQVEIRTQESNQDVTDVVNLNTDSAVSSACDASTHLSTKTPSSAVSNLFVAPVSQSGQNVNGDSSIPLLTRQSTELTDPGVSLEEDSVNSSRTEDEETSIPIQSSNDSGSLIEVMSVDNVEPANLLPGVSILNPHFTTGNEISEAIEVDSMEFDSGILPDSTDV